jgi:hypothetical protein
MLITPVIEGSPAPAPAPAKPGFDARSVNRAAVANWQTIYHHLVGLDGRPVGDILRLDPNYVPRDPGRARPPGERRISEMSGPSPYANEDGSGPGAWVMRGNGANGPDVISLIQWLARDCDRRVAADFLKSLTDRLVEVPV